MKVDPVELTAPDGVVLRGQHWLGGDSWIILLHEPGKDLDAWQPVMLPLHDKAYSLLTLDLRGHGISDGEWAASALGGDLDTAIGFAHERGAQRIAVIGAGESVLPAMMSARAQHLFAIVALSPEPAGDVPLDELRGGNAAKLFAVGSLGKRAVEAEQQIRDRVIGWRVRLSLPTQAQGTSLLIGQWKLHVQEHIVSFLEEQRFLSSGPRGTAAGAAQAEMLFRHVLAFQEQPDDAASAADQS